MNKILLISLLAMILVLGCVDEPMHQEENDWDDLDYQDELDYQDDWDDLDYEDDWDYQDDWNGLDDFPDFDEDFFDLEKPSEYKVVYEFTTSYEGETIKQTYGHYFKENNTRIDSTVDGLTSMMFFLNGKVYMCSDSTEEIMCMDTMVEESPESYMQDFQMYEEEFQSQYYNNQVIKLSDEVIAGKNAECFGMSMSGMPEVGDFETKYCFVEGILAYVKSESDYGLTEMKATEISFDVSDSVFVLPAEPFDFDDLY